MIRSANIATMPSRLNQLSIMLESIYDQFDEIRICLNEFESVPKWLEEKEKVIIIIPDKDGEPYNATDNGKFAYCMSHARIGLDHEYYFTLDDDIVYPPNYVEETVKNIDTYGCIVTYHGRTLIGAGRGYYREHEVYHNQWEQKDSFEIDVAGTGVSAFRTDYFCPSEIAFSKYQCMSDLVFSLEAAKQGKTIGCCARPAQWFKLLKAEDTIFDKFQGRLTPDQNKLADEIFNIRFEERNGNT